MAELFGEDGEEDEDETEAEVLVSGPITNVYPANEGWTLKKAAPRHAVTSLSSATISALTKAQQFAICEGVYAPVLTDTSRCTFLNCS